MILMNKFTRGVGVGVGVGVGRGGGWVDVLQT